VVCGLGIDLTVRWAQGNFSAASKTRVLTGNCFKGAKGLFRLTEQMCSTLSFAMDVGCPQCQCEYELEDERVPEEGVTVKCTSCANVFRVKKKLVVEAAPARAKDGTFPSLPPRPPVRQWKVRHRGGNFFSCRDLTALQKWIIEGKVTRDHEISLNGEVWKRLGGIPELSSFFQIVEEAARGRALEALRSMPPQGTEAKPPASVKAITETWKEKKFTTSDTAAWNDISTQVVKPGLSQSASVKETQPNWHDSQPPSRRAKPFLETPIHMDSRDARDEDEEASLEKSSGWKRLIIGGIFAGAALGWYLGVYRPQQRSLIEKKFEESEISAEKSEAGDLAELDRLALAKVVEERILMGADAATDLDAGTLPVVDVGSALDAGALRADAGQNKSTDAGVAPKATFDSLLILADRLRDREKASQAMDAYGKAHDLEPSRVEPLCGRGLALLDLENPDAAEAAFEQALAISPRYGPAIMGMAEAFRGQKNTAKAIEWYEKYLAVLPNGGEAAVAKNNLERLKQ
jgi:predicted Zn finger-like uncharacterized protein